MRTHVMGAFLPPSGRSRPARPSGSSAAPATGTGASATRSRRSPARHEDNVLEHTGIAGQFARPHGVLGRVCGWIMAVGNADMEGAVVDALALGGDEHVLAIGFGPGVGVSLLARRLPHGRVAGIDPSETMLEQARRRCRTAVDAGHVELRLGRAGDLPWDDECFDAVCSVNNVQLWEPLQQSLDDVRRVLRPGGRLSLATHDWVAGEPIAGGPAAGRPLRDGLVTAIEAAGFADVRLSRRRALSGAALYVTARKPGPAPAP